MATSSPWGKVQLESTNLDEIMSEEFARGLQDKENKKYAEKIKCDLITVSKANDLNLQPEDILKVIQNDEIVDEFCDSDSVIAQVLQSQFDHEYNEELKRIEKQKNKESKVSISFDNYRRTGDVEYDSEEDIDQWKDMQKDWDRFETNEKKSDAIPKCGFKIDKECGEIITKHDADMCGVRNACRVMSFPPEFSTGDAAGFDMKLSNKVFNELRRCSLKRKTNKKSDRKENIATAEFGLDGQTRLILYKLINNQVLEEINGVIATGKEAVILHAYSDEHNTNSLILPKECAIKIFKTTLNKFKQRDMYIKDDWRFKERFSKQQNNCTVINMWAEKEMHNLRRMLKCGINCPNVVALKKHVLVMSFIGDKNIAAPKLKDAVLTEAELTLVYESIVEIMIKLYNEAHLIHGDLSEYNILWYDNKCWIIDVAQSVEPEHPRALEFLMRDCFNIINFFERRGLSSTLTKDQLFEKITSLNAEVHNAAMLERIHRRAGSINQATAPEQDNCLEEPYPFELAWERSIEEKNLKPSLPSQTILNDRNFCN